MAHYGPRPAPIAIKRIRGNPGKRRIDDSPQPETDGHLPEPPGWLDEAAHAKWDELIPLLSRMGVLARIDGDALARYCDTWSWWRRTRNFLAQSNDTFVIKDDDGKIKYIQQLPQVAIAHKLAAQLGRLAAELGMTPSSRSGIHLAGGVVGERELDPFEQMQRDNYAGVAGRIGGAS